MLECPECGNTAIMIRSRHGSRYCFECPCGAGGCGTALEPGKSLVKELEDKLRKVGKK